MYGANPVARLTSPQCEASRRFNKQIMCVADHADLYAESENCLKYRPGTIIIISGHSAMLSEQAARLDSYVAEIRLDYEIVSRTVFGYDSETPLKRRLTGLKLDDFLRVADVYKRR